MKQLRLLLLLLLAFLPSVAAPAQTVVSTILAGSDQCGATSTTSPPDVFGAGTIAQKKVDNIAGFGWIASNGYSNVKISAMFGATAKYPHPEIVVALVSRDASQPGYPMIAKITPSTGGAPVTFLTKVFRPAAGTASSFKQVTLFQGISLAPGLYTVTAYAKTAVTDWETTTGSSQTDNGVSTTSNPQRSSVWWDGLDLQAGTSFPGTTIASPPRDSLMQQTPNSNVKLCVSVVSAPATKKVHLEVRTDPTTQSVASSDVPSPSVSAETNLQNQRDQNP